MPPTELTAATGVTDLAVDLLVTSARFTRLAARESRTDLPHALWRALSQIEELGPLRVSDLAQADRCSQPTASTMVQRLERRGWVQRAADPDDSRAVRISVTDAGRQLLAANRRTAGEALAGRLSRLDETQRTALTEAMRTLRDLIDDTRSEEML
jgi:DNA-binding MarR family transcriptional regulator